MERWRRWRRLQLLLFLGGDEFGGELVNEKEGRINGEGARKTWDDAYKREGE